jgi:hypothetical protein
MGFAMAEQYFVKRGEKVSGPFTARQIKSGVKTQKLKDDDGISNSPGGPWKHLCDAYAPKTTGATRTGATRLAGSQEPIQTPTTRPQQEGASPAYDDEETSELAANSPKTDSNNPSVVQLDTMTFLVENLPKHEVFGRIKTAASLCHTVHGAFDRSGIIRGEGDSGITFAITIADSDDGVVFEIDGETPEGPINFGAWFDPTEAEGWGLFAVTELFNVAVNSKAANTVEEDVGLLSFNILNSLQAADLLGLDSETIAALTGVATADALEYDPENKGTLLIRRLSKLNAVGWKITIFVDGHEKGTLQNGGKLALSLPAGDTSIELRGGMMKRSKTLTIVAGEKTEAQCYFSELGFLGGGLVFKTEDG